MAHFLCSSSSSSFLSISLLPTSSTKSPPAFCTLPGDLEDSKSCKWRACSFCLTRSSRGYLTYPQFPTALSDPPVATSGVRLCGFCHKKLPCAIVHCTGSPLVQFPVSPSPSHRTLPCTAAPLSRSSRLARNSYFTCLSSFLPVSCLCETFIGKMLAWNIRCCSYTPKRLVISSSTAL